MPLFPVMSTSVIACCMVLSTCQLQILQRVQNTAVWLVFRERKFCHVTPMFKSLHGLSVKYRIDFKVFSIIDL